MSQSITNKDTKEIFEQSLFEEARDFEASKAALADKSERRAWKSFTVSMVFNVLLIGGIIMLISQQTLFPYLVTVDRNSGQAEIISVLDETKVSEQEAMDQFWLTNYVRWHESYNYMTIQADYDATLLFSTDDVGRQYKAMYEGENALDQIWGKRTEAVITILTIIPDGNDGDTARVRFAKTIRPTDSVVGQTTIWVATIGYKYDTNLKLTAKDRRKNPLGFQVTSYRIDPELRG